MNLFSGETILEIDLHLNEILKKSIDTSRLENVEHCVLRVIDIEELINNFDSFKDLLEVIDIICIVLSSSMINLEYTQNLLVDLKNKVLDIDYFIIANYQDKKDIALEVEKIEELLEEKTFGFSAVQENSKERIFSIIEEMLKRTVKKKKKPISKYNNIWSEIEQARNYETQGDKRKATKSFSNAASQFKRLFSNINIEKDREEPEVLYHLCKAWEFMLYAQENVKPEEFLEASNHFFEVSEIISDKKLKLLALGNSEFCKVLKLGMEFEQSNQNSISNDDYLKIKAIFNKTIDLYKQGGFEKEFKWALATSSYFDAFVEGLKKA